MSNSLERFNFFLSAYKYEGLFSEFEADAYLIRISCTTIKVMELWPRQRGALIEIQPFISP